VRLEEEIKQIEMAGVDLIHIDVMDGHFVPNITMGPFIVEGIKSITKIPLDIHLMIEHPGRYVKTFAKAAGKGDLITFHIETTKNPKEVISLIKDAGLKAGVSLNPDTSTESVENCETAWYGSGRTGYRSRRGHYRGKHFSGSS